VTGGEKLRQMVSREAGRGAGGAFSSYRRGGVDKKRCRNRGRGMAHKRRKEGYQGSKKNDEPT